MQHFNKGEEKIEIKSEKNLCQDCQECLQVLYSVLDGEADREQETFFYGHIQSCPHCLNCYEVDKTIQITIKEKISKKEVPIEIITFIEAKIKEHAS